MELVDMRDLGSRAVYAPVVELADTMDLGDVTLVKGFSAILTADILR